MMRGGVVAGSSAFGGIVEAFTAPPDGWTFLLVKPDALRRAGVAAVAAVVRRAGGRPTDCGEFWLDQTDVDDWYPEIADEPHYAAMVRYLTSGPVAIVALTAAEPFRTARVAKKSIRAAWGSGELRNWVHSPDSGIDRDSEWELFEPRLRRFAIVPSVQPGRGE